MTSKLTLRKAQVDIAKEIGVDPSIVSEVLNLYFHMFSECLHSGNSVLIKNIGSFNTRITSSRSIYNIAGGDEYIAPSKLKPVFNPSRQLVSKLNS